MRASDALARRMAQVEENRKAMPETARWVDVTRALAPGAAVARAYENGLLRESNLVGQVVEVAATDIVLSIGDFNGTGKDWYERTTNAQGMQGASKKGRIDAEHNRGRARGRSK